MLIKDAVLVRGLETITPHSFIHQHLFRAYLGSSQGAKNRVRYPQFLQRLGSMGVAWKITAVECIRGYKKCFQS